MVTFIVLAAATALGTTGQFLDAYTTYIGVDVKKIAVETNSSATWLVAHPALNFIVKTGGPLLAGCLGLFAAPHIAPDHTGLMILQVMIAGTQVAMGVTGLLAAKGNNAINNAKK
jgi:hypothetical protein